MLTRLVLPALLLSSFPLQPASAQIWERCSLRDELIGEAAGDQFGWVGENAGDVDGDGINDFIVGTPNNDGGGPNAGRVYVYSGVDSSLLFQLDGAAVTNRLGRDVSAAGDVNDDGFADVLVGGRREVRLHLGPNGALHWQLGSPVIGDGFGSSVSTAGDVNGDGVDDVIVGAPTDDQGGVNAGRVYVLSGVDGSILYEHSGEAAGDRAGSGVGFLKDRDSDGFDDYIFGAQSAGPAGTGRAYVHSGADGSQQAVIDSDATGANLGTFFMGWCGDPSGDGVPDFFVSDWANTANGANTGRVFVYSGVDLSLYLVLTGAAGDGFGIGRGWAGDYDADGRDDLIFGSWLASDGAPGAGKCSVHSGIDGSTLATWTGEVNGANLGFDAAGMGDLSGDGRPDFLLTAASQTNNRGVVLVVRGGPELPTHYCEGGLHSGNFAARLTTLDAISVSANRLKLQLDQAVPGALTVFFYGPDVQRIPLGGGSLCVGGGLFRLGTQNTDSSGSSQYAMDFSAAPLGSGAGQVTPGSSWSVQAWFRDTLGPGGSNLSNAVRLSFCD